MSSDPERRRRRSSRARVARAIVAVLCGVSLTLTPLIAPSAGLAQSSSSGGPASAPPYSPASANPNIGPPDKPPPGGGGGRGGGGEGRFPCRVKQCLEIVKQFCTSKAIKAVGGCAELAQKFLDTKKGDAREVLGDKKNPEKSLDLAFQDPFFGVGFQVHHIVPQGPPFDGVARFAQSILQRVGIKLNDEVNLSALRDFTLKRGMKGYNDLPKRKNGKILQKRLAHADAQTRFYYQTVNEIFAKRFGGLIKRGKEPTKAQVEALLQEIKNDLYNGDGRFIAPGKAPRARDLLRL